METNENEICYIRFGKMIATMRSSQGKTQDAFADECGISKSELRKIEEGHTLPWILFWYWQEIWGHMSF